MILLEELEVENFKSLRRLSLRFPSEGSVLVEGLNESGKSSLFECVYFALYGSPLVTESARGADEAIRYGCDSASVCLALDVNGTRVVVSRVIRKGRPNEATLEISSSGAPQETVRGPRAVSARLIEELGKLDGEALLNSCFVEQKKLSKLEDLSAAARRESLLKLLNLEKLAELETYLKPTRADEDAVHLAENRLELAGLRDECERLGAEEASISRLTTALSLRKGLLELADLRRQKSEAMQRREHFEIERAQVHSRSEEAQRLRSVAALARELAERLNRCAAEEQRIGDIKSVLVGLRQRLEQELPALAEKAGALGALAQKAAACDEFSADLAMLEARLRESERLKEREQQLRAGIERVEADLTAIDSRAAVVTAALAGLDSIQSGISATESEIAALESLESGLVALDLHSAQRADQEREIATLQDRIAAAGSLERQIAQINALLAQVGSKAEDCQAAHKSALADLDRLSGGETIAGALGDWIRGRTIEDARDGDQAAIEKAQKELRRREQQRDELAGQKAAFGARSGRLFAAAGALVLAAIVLGLAAGLLVPIILAFAATASCGVAGFSAKAKARATGTKLSAAEKDCQVAEELLRRLEAEYEAAKRLSGGAELVSRAQGALARSGVTVPADVAAAVSRRSDLLRQLAGQTRSELEQRRANAASKLREAEAERDQLAGQKAALQGQRDEQSVEEVRADYARFAYEVSRAQAALIAEREGLTEESARIGVATDISAVRQRLTALRESLGSLKARLSERERLEKEKAAIEAEQALRAARRGELKSEFDEILRLLALAPIDLAQQLEDRKRTYSQERSDIASTATKLGVEPDSASLREAAARAEESHGAVKRELSTSLDRGEDELVERNQVLDGLRDKLFKDAAALATLGVDGFSQDASPAELIQVAERSECQAGQLAEFDQSRSLEDLDAAIGQEREREAAALRAEVPVEDGVRVLLAKLGPPEGTELDLAAVENALPIVAEAEDLDEAAQDKQARDVGTALGVAKVRRDGLERQLQLVGVRLDAGDCHAELGREQHRLEVKRRAVKIVTEARKRMVAKVLPNTERNMRLLLPLLTAGRYRDARITEDYRIEVWDETANRFVAKSIFSGGTRDQFSLALRLAFALATLPQELGSTPGFIFLDEPLSSFDGPRTQALVDLLTRGQIATSFRQIFVISHSRSFDPAQFTYRLRLDSGQVVESSLP